MDVLVLSTAPIRARETRPKEDVKLQQVAFQNTHALDELDVRLLLMALLKTLSEMKWDAEAGQDGATGRCCCYRCFATWWWTVLDSFDKGRSSTLRVRSTDHLGDDGNKSVGEHANEPDKSTEIKNAAGIDFKPPNDNLMMDNSECQFPIKLN